MSPEVYAALVSSVLSGAFASALAWFLTKSDLGQKNRLLAGELARTEQQLNKLAADLNAAQQQTKRLAQFETKYNAVKEHLIASSVVREYSQPVILVGPRAVGKTSLLAQWHAPWDHSRLNPTQTHNTSTVPIYDFKRTNTEPHFADAEILTDVHVHLKLKIHDFPGELSAQQKIIEEATTETVALRKSTGKSIGIVLICLFDADETGRSLSGATTAYYNGELFSKLRKLVAHNRIAIERLVLVFNKYDLLKRRNPNKDDAALLTDCIDAYQPILSLLRGACNSERVCEVFTVLNREDMASNNRGAPIVMGEAARRFVEAMAGVQAVQNVVRDSATNYAAPLFQ